MVQTLMPDTQAPELSLPKVGGGTWVLSEQKPKNFTIAMQKDMPRRKLFPKL